MMKYFAFTFVFLQAKVQAVNHIVNGWSPQGGPYPSIDAAAGDTITFVWTGNHNVHRLSVDNCVTTSQNLITSISNTPIPINAVDAGSTFFFACGVGNHCESGQKGQVVVRDNSDANIKTKWTSDCPTYQTSNKRSSRSANSTTNAETNTKPQMQ